MHQIQLEAVIGLAEAYREIVGIQDEFAVWVFLFDESKKKS